MATRQFKWGIIGTGKIAADFVTALSYLPDARVVAVGSRTQEAADAFAKRHGIDRGYASHDDVANDPEVELVYVSTFHPFHKKAASAAIAKGKAVLVEKPLTINATEARELIEQARKRGVLLMEAMWTRYFPASIKMRELVRSTIGDVKGVLAPSALSTPASLDSLNQSWEAARCSTSACTRWPSYLTYTVAAGRRVCRLSPT